MLKEQLNKQVFEAWLYTRKGTFIGRSCRAGEGPLDLYLKLHNPKLVNLSVNNPLVWYVDNGQTKREVLPAWAMKFARGTGFLPETNDVSSVLPSVTYHHCIDLLKICKE